jgi:hypothetical protein
MAGAEPPYWTAEVQWFGRIGGGMTDHTVPIKLLDLLVQLLGAVRGRPLLHVRLLQDDPRIEVGGLRFEIENRRQIVTSLAPQIVVRYHWCDDSGFHRGREIFHVRELDRTLPPHQPKIMNASADRRPKHYLFGWYRTYRFRPTSGMTTRLRIRNTLLETLPLWKFVWEFFRFRLLGKAEAGGPETYDDYKRQQRAKGPH